VETGDCRYWTGQVRLQADFTAVPKLIENCGDLVCTDATSEGLNLHTASALIEYDQASNARRGQKGAFHKPSSIPGSKSGNAQAQQSLHDGLLRCEYRQGWTL